MQHIGLQKQYCNVPEVKQVISLIISLPLLPADKVNDGFIMIKANFTQRDIAADIKAKLHDLFNYVNRQWLQNVGAAKLSVYQQVHRTNNSHEAFHRKVGERLNHHASIWTFLGKTFFPKR